MSLWEMKLDVVKLSASIMWWIFTILEVLIFFSKPFEDIVKEHKTIKSFLIGVCLSCLIALIVLWPKKKFQVRLRDCDAWINLEIWDAFNIDGALVVPFNSSLDVSLWWNVAKAKSLHSTMIKQYFGDEKNLDALLKKENDRLPLPIWTVIDLWEQGINKRKHFYLLINTEKQINNPTHVSGTTNDFETSVVSLREFLSNSANKAEPIIVPLISAQHARDSNLTRDYIIKYLVNSFVDFIKYKPIVENITICISPLDLQKWWLDFKILCKYLEFHANNYRKVVHSKKVEWIPYESSKKDK